MFPDRETGQVGVAKAVAVQAARFGEASNAASNCAVESESGRKVAQALSTSAFIFIAALTTTP